MSILCCLHVYIGLLLDYGLLRNPVSLVVLKYNGGKRSLRCFCLVCVCNAFEKCLFNKVIY